jgi:hypothetical protein
MKFFPSPALLHSRRGIALALVMALGICVAIITLTYAYGTSKAAPKAGFLTRLKADYQMESAILLQFHRLRQANGKFDDIIATGFPKQEIAPGLSLRVAARKESPQCYHLTVHVEGLGIQKVLAARALNVFAGSSTPELSASGTLLLASSSWKLELTSASPGTP